MGNDFASRVRALKTASVNGTLAKELGLGTYVLTGWLGGKENGKDLPRIRMETIQVQARGLTNAKKKYLSQFKNQLPSEARELDSGLVIIRVRSNDERRTFPADTPAVDGIVKYFNDDNGMGAVVAGGVEYFVHHGEIVVDDEDIFPTLKAGETVRFIPAEREGKPVACSVWVETA